jgi:hypothetical protein
MYVIAGPVVWAIHDVAAYLLVPRACTSHSAALAIHAISIAALVVLALLSISAKRRYQSVSLGSQATEVDNWPPERWVPAACAILSSVFFLVILAQAIPTFIIEQCQ